ncbi:HCP-like protein, partial [Patellaria atrata CBS 101060]
RASTQSGSSVAPSSDGHSITTSRDTPNTEISRDGDSTFDMPETKSIPYRQRNVHEAGENLRRSNVAEIVGESSPKRDDRSRSNHGKSRSTSSRASSSAHTPSSGHAPSSSFHAPRSELLVPLATAPRPKSSYTLGSELRGRTHSPHLSVGGSPTSSPVAHGRAHSAHRRSPDMRPMSYVDLLNVPYAQQIAPAGSSDNAYLQKSVGSNASLLDTRKTLEMYRMNLKKTNEPSLHYEFALYLISFAQQAEDTNETAELIRESRTILQQLSNRGYPFAQYYLADGYASGLFNKGKEDYDKAFPLFVSASKHGHAEAGYRAALCYEFGWGGRKDYAKAVQFYRASASKNHPGAATRLGKACLTGEMGLQGKYREGIKWLKRAAEAADHQYNSAPYELGTLHVTGFGDDIFKDEAYAAQLFTKSAELGHPEANLRMGEAYEHGLLMCPKDPALSVHFYNGAAQAGIPEAMMALCAWYMVGAEPVLEKDENEAYEWAKKAAELGLPKAEYAVGYFTEMGIGCRRDPLEANVWYVKAADQGDDRARQRLAIIRAAASGDPGIPVSEKKVGKKGGKDDKD